MSDNLDADSVKLLRDIVIDSAYKTGDDFFKSIVKDLGEAIGADFTFVGTLAGVTSSKVTTLAIYSHGQYIDNFTYDLADTPCMDVVGKSACIYKDKIKERFPKDYLLIEMGIEGYVGVPLYDSEHKPLGILVGLYRSPVKDEVRVEAILQLMANRTAGEIERYQLELRLKKSEERFRKYIEVSPVGIFLFNKAGKFMFFNRAALELTGYKQEETSGLTIRDLTFEEKRARFNRKLAALYREGKLKTEMTLRNKSGEGLKVVVEILQIEENLYLGFCTDISELNRMELKLRQSEKMRAIGQLAGGIAHDFNNQLSGIVGYADLLKRQTVDHPGMARKVNGILTASKRAADLTANLLAFAREDRYISEIMDVNDVIAEVVELLKRSIDKRISISTNLLEEKPLVTGDPTQIQNLLLNIAINGRDAMPDGGDLNFGTRFIELDHEYCSFSQFPLVPGMFVVISITDNGTGMDEETLKRIFEPFFTTKQPGFGTGMGLAAVYGTVKAHQGEVVVESNPGYGTTFEILLPLAEEGENSGHGYSEEPAIDSSLKGFTLIVDDDENIRGATELILEQLGVHSSSVGSGSEALEYFRNNQESTDLVMIDMVLPDMKGDEVFRELKKIKKDVKVIITSGHNIEGIARDVKAEGVKAILQKPFHMSDLYNTLSGIL